MPDFVINLLPKEGKLVQINPSCVSNRFIKYLKRLDMRRFRFHDLRHYLFGQHHARNGRTGRLYHGTWRMKFRPHFKNIYRGSMDDFSRKYTDRKRISDTSSCKCNQNVTELFCFCVENGLCLEF